MSIEVKGKVKWRACVTVGMQVIRRPKDSVGVANSVVRIQLLFYCYCDTEFNGVVRMN